ncbi:hypothetical protein HAX54_031228, partial [Datura stramonium]|nr:hypothetical protein [Datura stramonium]
IEIEMPTMRELLEGLPIPPPGDRTSSAAVADFEGLQRVIASLAQAYIESRRTWRERRGSGAPRTSSSSVCEKELKRSLRPSPLDPRCLRCLGRTSSSSPSSAGSRTTRLMSLAVTAMIPLVRPSHSVPPFPVFLSRFDWLPPFGA